MVFRKMEFHSNKIYDVFLTVQCNRRLRDRDGCIRPPSSGRGWRSMKPPGRLPREGGGWSSLRWSRRSILQPATRLSLQTWSAVILSSQHRLRTLPVSWRRRWDNWRSHGGAGLNIWQGSRYIHRSGERMIGRKTNEGWCWALMRLGPILGWRVVRSVSWAEDSGKR